MLNRTLRKWLELADFTAGPPRCQRRPCRDRSDLHPQTGTATGFAETVAENRGLSPVSPPRTMLQSPRRSTTKRPSPAAVATRALSATSGDGTRGGK